jgi:hypothetical protein
MNSIKTLQENLAKDLVKLEELDIKERILTQIETTYQTIYDIITKIDQGAD